MNLKDIAKLCNVSVSTVSKAFCDADDVSAETKEMIFKVAKENGCYEKYCKGKYHKFVVAAICPEVKSEYYSGFLEALQPAIEQVGGIMIIAADGFDNERQQELVEYFASQNRADGIIVFSLKTLKKGYDVPIITIGNSLPTVDSVLTDCYDAVNEAVRYLKELGHTKIAFIGEQLTSTKQRTFEKAMLDNMLHTDESSIIVSDSRFEDAGFSGAEQLLKTNSDYTAIFCAYDHIAIGAMKYLEQQGFRIPEDYSVIGMDNIGPSEYLMRSLTTVDGHIDQVCSILADLMAKKIKSRWVTAKQQIKIRADFIIRESTGPARSSK